MNQNTATKLNDMHHEMISGRTEHSGYPDPLDLLGLLWRHPDLAETIDFWEFRKAYDWLSETAQQNHRNGRHQFTDSAELARRSGCSTNAIITAAIGLGLKTKRRGSYTAFKFPPFEK